MRISFKSYYDIINLILLTILIWIYGAGGGHHMGKKWAMMKKAMEEHHHHHHHEEKSLAIPIPIPLIVKEKGDSQPPPPYYPPPALPCMMKSHDKKGHDMKDFIWKMMMIKMMKDKGSKTIIKEGKGKGCCGKTKIIKFPDIMKSKSGCAKGCKAECPKACDKMHPEEPEEEYPDYEEEDDGGRLMGWETSNHVPVFRYPEDRHRNKFVSMATNRRGDIDDFDYNYYGK